MRPRVACYSPLPPAASGIADYTAELMPHLACLLDLTGVVGDGDPAPSSLDEGIPVMRASTARRREDEFDLHLYQLGNNPEYHAHVWKALHCRPGVVVLHEFMLHHLVRGLTVSRGDLDGYLEEMRYAYGRSAARLAEQSVASGLPLEVWSYPLFERVVDSSRGVIVHSEYTRRRVLRSRPAARVEVIPHHLALPDTDGDEATRESARRHLGYRHDDLVIGCFGFVTPEKRLDVVARAFRRVRRRLPEARLLVAGSISRFYDVDRLVGHAGGQIQVTGRLSLGQLVGAMRACDLAVNLRWPTGGETSGTLMRLLGLGCPVIVSDQGSFSEIPPQCAARVAPDDLEEEHLTALMERLLTDPELARSMGRNAQRLMEEEHTLEGSARAYADYLERILTDAPPVFEPAPPLLPLAAADMSGRALARMGRAAAELGIHEGDRSVLARLAHDAATLGLGTLGGRVE